MKKILIGAILLIVIVALAGMYKFNYLSNQPGYNVDGNKNNQNSINISEDKKFSVTVTDGGSLKNPISAGDVINIGWEVDKSCDGVFGITLSRYIENSPHKTAAYPITNGTTINPFLYKIESNVPTGEYKIWVYNAECNVGAYGDEIIYIQEEGKDEEILLKTQYDFIYTIEEFTQGIYGDNYSLRDGVLVKLGEVPKKLYIYSAEDGISREISFDEAQKYYISSEKTSPEGYVFEYNDDNNGYFIYKGSSKNKINIAENKYIENYQYFKRAVKFIGWIIE